MGRNVPDVRTPACMKAPEVPPLTVRTSVQSAGRLSKFSGGGGGAWAEIGADLWVMCIVQWGYKIPFVTLPPLRLQGQETTYPKGSLKWSSLSQSVQELRNKGAIEPTPFSRAFTADCSEWRPIIRSVLPQCLRALPELHYGDTSVNLQGPSTGPVVNLPRPERCLLSYRVDPADRRCSVTTAPLGSSQYCHSGCQPV